MKYCLLSVMVLLGTIGCDVLWAQEKPLDRFAPTREQMLQRYKMANERDTLARTTVFKTAVTPGWSGGSAFWYRNALPDSQYEFHFVDP
ncbi:MAG: hypothetical protein ABI581_14880, partial [Sediminibacterium sp.]